MRTVLASTLSACLTLVACSSPCDRLVADDKTISSRSCVPDDGGTVPTTIEFGSNTTTVAQCDTAIKSCSSQDLTYLNTYLNCLEAVPVCTAANSDTAITEPADCVSQNLSFLSEACTTAFAGSYDTGLDGGT